MKGDFSRFTFDRSRHFSGVLLQQGRVQLDADWNEQLDIASHLRRRAIADLLGPSGAPEVGGGFDITVAGGEIRISPGRFWVDGILVENDEESTVNDQPHLPSTNVPTEPDDASGFPSGLYAAYVDVWERHITALEEPALLEPALGSPDTGTRRQTIWQLKLEKLDSEDLGCPDLVGWSPTAAATTATLAARTVGTSDDNRLYRVEVHRSSDDPGGATFKWSRDNGAVAARIDNPSLFQIDITHQIDQDAADGFAAGQWIEITDEAMLLEGKPGLFTRLAAVAGQTLTVEGWPDATDPVPNLPNNPLVRRWDSLGDISIPAGDDFFALEAGLEIRFDNPSVTTTYRSGDFWLVPVRSGAGALWPLDQTTGEPLLQPPDGIEHRFATLALLRLDERAAGADTGWSLVETCRTVFKPVSEFQGEKVSVFGDTMTGPLLIEEASLTVRAGDTTALKVIDTGRVGVGTDKPRAKLQVVGGALMLAESDDKDDKKSGILFPAGVFEGPGNSAWIRYYAGSGDATTLEIGTKGDNRADQKHIALMPTGNVGIGTRVPSSELEVAGGIRVRGGQGGVLLYNDKNASGAPASDGFRMRYQSNFFGTNLDALVIEKTDHNQDDPDGGVAFVNTGKDGVAETALSIRGNGRVGLGTDDPDSRLHVAGAVRITGDANGTLLYNKGSAAGPPSSDGFRLRFQGDFFGGTRDALVIEKTDGNSTEPDGGIAFVNTGGNGKVATAMVIRGNGRVGINTKDPKDLLDVNGSISANRVFGIDILGLSDARWKQDVTTLTDCLEKVESLRGVGFAWRQERFPDMAFTLGRHLGFIAQEVEAVLPELVMTRHDGFKSLAYGNMTAVLVEAIKELSGRLRTLEKRMPTAGSESAEVAS